MPYLPNGYFLPSMPNNYDSCRMSYMPDVHYRNMHYTT
jgi:hypothetical protein